jgi:hypothetical protein
MIALSRLRRAAPIALFLLSLSGVGSCESRNACTLIGCPGTGLDIQFTGDLAPNTTLDIQVSLVEQGQASVPVITCTLSAVVGADGGAERLLCTSALWISQSGSRTLNTHEIIEAVQVTISSNGTQLAQQATSPQYTRTTPNGPNCNECVFSTITVALPQLSQP